MNATPRIYLFLSVDIIGSTELKYNSETDWVNEIINFYSVFYETLTESIVITKEYYKLKNHDKLITWKYSGDEILFYINITEDNEILSIMDAFAKTLGEMAEPEKNNKLKFKGTSWLGQVPFIDIEFNKDNLTDFIGTSIDCGFRLGKFATQTDLIVSMEIAYIWSISTCSSSIHVRFLRKEKLKGVLGNFEYPIFSIKLNINHPEKDLIDSCNKTNLKNYIETLIQSPELEKYNGKVSLITKKLQDYLDEHRDCSKDVANKYKYIKTIDEISDKATIKEKGKRKNMGGTYDTGKYENLLKAIDENAMAQRKIISPD